MQVGMQISHLTRPVERVRSRYCKLCSSHCDDNMMMPRPGHCSPASGDVIMRPRDSRCYTTLMRAGHLTWMATPHHIARATKESHFTMTLQLDFPVCWFRYTREDSGVCRGHRFQPGVSGPPNDLSTVRPGYRQSLYC